MNSLRCILLYKLNVYEGTEHHESDLILICMRGEKDYFLSYTKYKNIFSVLSPIFLKCHFYIVN
jgi:hypothetical protein